MMSIFASCERGSEFKALAQSSHPNTQEVKKPVVQQVSPPQPQKSAQLSAHINANGGVMMNIQNPKKPTISFQKFTAGVVLATSLSGAP
jgi:hypothetical protein